MYEYVDLYLEALPLLRLKYFDILREELVNPTRKVSERVQFIKQIAAKLQYIDDVEAELHRG